MNKKIALIIPFYNRKKYLLKTLQSLTGLFALPNAYSFKIYLMDDGSDAEVFSENDVPFELRPHTLITRLKHVGRPAHAKNEGAKLARDADYLFFLDSDDIIDVAVFFQAIKKAAKHANTDVFPLNSFYINEKDERFKPYGKKNKYSFFDPRPFLWNAFGHSRSLLCANHIGNFPLIRRAAFEKIGGFREDVIVEDYEIWIRAHYMGLQFHFLKHAVYGVRVHSGGRSFDKAKEIQDVMTFLNDSKLRALMGEDADNMKSLWTKKLERI